MSSTTSNPRRGRLVTAAGLVVGAAGIVLQNLAGVEMPAVPPGLVLLVIAAALIALTRWRWPIVLGALVALLEVVMLALIGAVADLVDADSAAVLLATWVRAAGVATALVVGVVTLAGLRRSQSTASAR